jgi:hypothetical protein
VKLPKVIAACLAEIKVRGWIPNLFNVSINDQAVIDLQQQFETSIYYSLKMKSERELDTYWYCRKNCGSRSC